MNTPALERLTTLTHEANAGIARVNASQAALDEALAHVERIRLAIVKLGTDIVAERQSREAQIVADSASLRAITERGRKRGKPRQCFPCGTMSGATAENCQACGLSLA